jgi:type I restriction enzyme S subunit
MADWVSKRLDEIVEFNPRETIKKGVIAKKIAMDKLQPFCRDITEFELEPFSGGTKFRNGDTIMARITPCLENGKTAKVNILDDGEVGFGSTEYIVFRAREGVDADFVYYLISSPFVRKPAIRSMVGSSGRQRVQTDVVQGITVMVPTLEEQKAISGILKLLDDKIAVNRKINDNLQEQAQALYTNMFIQNNSNQWSEGVLSDVAEIIMGQSPKGDTYNENGEGTVFFQGRGEFGFRFPTRRLFTTNPKRMAQSNDVLMSVRAPVGDLNVAYEPCCIGRGLGAIRSKDGHQSFVLYTVFSLREKLDMFNGEGTVFGSINRDALNSMPIVIPTKEETDRFEEIVAPMDAAIRNNYEEICRLEAIRDSLLPRLMSGELDVSNLDL